MYFELGVKIISKNITMFLSYALLLNAFKLLRILNIENAKIYISESVKPLLIVADNIEIIIMPLRLEGGAITLYDDGSVTEVNNKQKLSGLDEQMELLL